jgi:chromosome segregation ATPase
VIGEHPEAEEVLRQIGEQEEEMEKHMRKMKDSNRSVLKPIALPPPLKKQPGEVTQTEFLSHLKQATEQIVKHVAEQRKAVAHNTAAAAVLKKFSEDLDVKKEGVRVCREQVDELHKEIWDQLDKVELNRSRLETQLQRVKEGLIKVKAPLTQKEEQLGLKVSRIRRESAAHLETAKLLRRRLEQFREWEAGAMAADMPAIPGLNQTILNMQGELRQTVKKVIEYKRELETAGIDCGI